MTQKRTRVYLCEDSLEGILSAVHQAYYSRYGHSFIRIEEGDNQSYELFYEYEEVKTDMTHARSVADSVRRKISYEAWEVLKKASMHERTGKAQDIYRFLNYGYSMGNDVLHYLSEDHVRRVVFDSKTVARETDRLMGFVRFQELKDGSLFGRIGQNIIRSLFWQCILQTGFRKRDGFSMMIEENFLLFMYREEEWD